MRMPEELEYWTADEVAECLPISNKLSGKLWRILGECENKTPLGGDGSDGTVEEPQDRLDLDNDDKTAHWWHKLTEEEQKEITEATTKLNTDDPMECIACLKFHSDEPCVGCPHYKG